MFDDITFFVTLQLLTYVNNCYILNLYRQKNIILNQEVFMLDNKSNFISKIIAVGSGKVGLGNQLSHLYQPLN